MEDDYKKTIHAKERMHSRGVTTEEVAACNKFGRQVKKESTNNVKKVKLGSEVRERKRL